MKQVTYEQMWKEFDPSESIRPLLEADIKRAINKYHPTHLVVFQNQLLDSSNLGDWSVMVIGGPGTTHKTLSDVKGKWIGDLPSQRKYPVAYVDLEVYYASEKVSDGAIPFIVNELRKIGEDV